MSPCPRGPAPMGAPAVLTAGGPEECFTPPLIMPHGRLVAVLTSGRCGEGSAARLALPGSDGEVR